MPVLGPHNQWVILDTTEDVAEHPLLTHGGFVQGFYSEGDAQTFVDVCHPGSSATRFEIVQVDELKNQKALEQAKSALGT